MIWVRSVCHSVRSSFTCFEDVDSTPEWLRPLWDLKSNNRWKGDKILKCFFGYLDLNISGVTSSPGWTPPARLYLPRTLKDSPEHAHFVPRRNTEMLKYLWTFKSRVFLPPLIFISCHKCRCLFCSFTFCSSPFRSKTSSFLFVFSDTVCVNRRAHGHH